MNRPLLHLLISFALGASLVASVSAAVPESIDKVKIVTAEQARDLQAKGAPLVDTRVAAEYAEKTIKGAISITYREKSTKAAEFDKSQDAFDLGKLPQDKSKPVVFFCNGPVECWRSYKASIYARDAGYTQVHWLRGGMPEWTAKGLPTQ
jgi:rhodanese-related sulfurtransferase